MRADNFNRHEERCAEAANKKAAEPAGAGVAEAADSVDEEGELHADRFLCVRRVLSSEEFIPQSTLCCHEERKEDDKCAWSLNGWSNGQMVFLPGGRTCCVARRRFKCNHGINRLWVQSWID